MHWLQQQAVYVYGKIYLRRDKVLYSSVFLEEKKTTKTVRNDPANPKVSEGGEELLQPQKQRFPCNPQRRPENH